MWSFATGITLLLSATHIAAQFNNQSAPFNLVLVSEDSSVNGEYLAACHEGAGFEALCLSSKVGGYISTFNFNGSEFSESGVLTYELIGGNFNESQAMQLYVSPTTNVAIPMFEPSYTETFVAFDGNDLMNIQGYVIDTVNPPTYGDFLPYYRWYSCTTYYSGYTYPTLTWVLGEKEPQNPTCVKVDVKRVFI